MFHKRTFVAREFNKFFVKIVHKVVLFFHNVPQKN